MPPAQFYNTLSDCFYVGQLFWVCVLQVRVTAMADTNFQTDLIWGCHALINVNQYSMTYFKTLNNDSPINDPQSKYISRFNERHSDCSHSSFTNRSTFIKTLITIYIKIRWLLHISVYDHHQGACN